MIAMTLIQSSRRIFARRLVRGLVGAGLLLLGMALVPHRWCAREASAWYAGDRALQQRLASGVERWIEGDLSVRHFNTGVAQFDGEWLFGTYLMAGLGFGQTALARPEWKAHHTELMALCIDRLLTPEVRAFDRAAWQNDPLDTLDGPGDHGAYLGYLNLLLSLHRRLAPDSRHAALNDRITAALARRLDASPLLLLHSYPNEVYPVDNCAAIGSLALYDRATGADHRVLLQRWIERCRARYVDPKTGLLLQCVDPGTGRPADHPRGSGTCLGLYFLSFADRAFSRELYRAVDRELSGTWLGFGGVREYPRTVRNGRGDIDSGPIVFGFGLSATGFALGGARLHGDPAQFARLYSTAYLCGAPYDRDERRGYITGGPLGDAILFAMLTADATLSDAKM